MTVSLARLYSHCETTFHSHFKQLATQEKLRVLLDLVDSFCRVAPHAFALDAMWFLLRRRYLYNRPWRCSLTRNVTEEREGDWVHSVDKGLFISDKRRCKETWAPTRLSDKHLPLVIKISRNAQSLFVSTFKEKSHPGWTVCSIESVSHLYRDRIRACLKGSNDWLIDWY